MRHQSINPRLEVIQARYRGALRTLKPMVLAMMTGLMASATSAQVSFHAITTLPVGAGPYSVAVGDFNGDLKQDLAVANHDSGYVSILAGNGSGGFSPAVNFGAGGGPFALAVGDFNGDGKQDLAVANIGSGTVSILIGDGVGGFAAAANFAAGSGPHSVAVGDFNADGKQDLAVANYGTSYVSILMGDGLGAFASAVGYGVGINPVSVAVGDFNLDGKEDLAVANSGQNHVSVLAGDGSGAFAAAVNFVVGPGPYSVAVGDFNADGKQDLAVANSGSNSASILAGDGLGGFAAAVQFSVGNTPFGVAVGDFDGDGRHDLAVANWGSQNLSILLGDGLGALGTAVQVGVGNNPFSVKVADFNGDGKQDLAVANRGSNSVSVLPGNGLGGFVAPSFAVGGGQPRTVAVGDFNGDSKQDVVTANMASNSVSVLAGNGLDGLSVPAVYGVLSTPVAVAVGDFNADSKKDLVVADMNSNAVSILIGDGVGNFAVPSHVGVGASPHSIAVGDFNGDSKQDLAVANIGSNTVSVLLGNGLGGFSVPASFATGPGPHAVVAGDFNGDTNQDLAVANLVGNSVAILMGNGSGSFAAPATFSVGAGPIHLATGDFNGDASLDLASANLNNNTVSILLGDGLGGFAAAAHFGAGVSPAWVAVADFNGDAKQDMAVANINSQNVLIYVGNGSGGFSPPISVPSTSGPHSVGVADFNGDGRPDLAVANLNSSTVAMFLNLTPTPCAAGTWSVNGLDAPIACTPASAGHFVAATGATVETPCTAGTFQPLAGQTSCNPAPAGSFVSMSGATASSPCAMGSFQPLVGQTSCVPASAGHSVAGSGSPSEAPCSVGSFQPLTGQTSCIPAPAGSFVNIGAATGAIPCSTGSFQPLTGQASCDSAPAGSFVSVAAAITATPCSPGSYQPLTGQPSCTLASSGFFVPGSGATTQTACAPGFTSGAGATVCVPATTTVVNITGVPTAANEGSPTGTTNFVFTLTRTGPATVFNVNYTLTGTAVAPEDYPVLSGTVNFSAAATTRNITVAIRRDTKFEVDESVILTLTAADSGVVIGGNFTASTTVVNDDTPPTISIGNRTVTEGALANFAVTLSNGSYLPVSVTATTADGTANGLVTAPFPQADYTANPGTVVTFAANATVLSQNVGIPTINDTVYEGGTLGTKETFFVNLSAPSGGVIGIGTGNGLITDNEPLPTVSITGPSSQQESISPYTFTVSLSRQSVDTIQVMVDAVDGTAQQVAAPFPQADFNPLSQLLTFLPGETSKTVDVTVIDDGIDEANEAFSVQLSGLVNVGPGTMSDTGIINDNDALPLVSIVATSSPVAEAAGTATFTVSLSAMSGRTTGVTVQTVPTPGTAVAGVDYTAMSTPLTWAAGDITAQTLVVPIAGDTLNELSETFRATLTSPVNATPNPAFATMTIVDDDPIPTISIGDVSVTEGNTPSTVNASFTVSLSAASGQTITVRAGTANDTATVANNDYIPQSNVVLTFSPLQTSQQFQVSVNGDDVLENDETFFVNLHSPSATVTILNGQGTGTIQNDDSPALSIGDAQVVETNAGQVSLSFNVTIPGTAPVGGVAFDFDTTDGSATLADNDYVQVTGGSGFIPFGANSTTVSVLVNGDPTVELNETLTVTISNASLPSFPMGIVTILDPIATSTILNDDAVPAGALVISEFRLSGPNGINDEFIEIANTTTSPIMVSTTDLSAGFSVAQLGGAQVFTILNGTVIPARGHLLAVNTNGYSLQNYGGPNAANANRTWTSNIADDTGLALFATASIGAYSSATPLDAVGFSGVDPKYKEGTPLAGIGAGPFPNHYSFVRRYLTGAGTGLMDGGDNALDWALVSTNPSALPTGALLGGPSPENLLAETEYSNAELTLTTPDGGFVVDSVSTPKTVKFYRLFTNNTGGNLNSLRFKVTHITTTGTLVLSPTNSLTEVGGITATNYLALDLEQPPAYSDAVAGGDASNGGLNSTLRLSPSTYTFPLLPLPVIPNPPDGTVGVNFKAEYSGSGSFAFWLVPQAKP